MFFFFFLYVSHFRRLKLCIGGVYRFDTFKLSLSLSLNEIIHPKVDFVPRKFPEEPYRRSRPIDRRTDKFLCSEADGRYARFSRSCSIPTPSGRRSRILPSAAATTRSGILGSTTRYLLSTTTWSRCHLLVRWQCGVTRHVTDSPSPQVDERWACLPAARCPAPITTRTLAAGAPT